VAVAYRAGELGSEQRYLAFGVDALTNLVTDADTSTMMFLSGRRRETARRTERRSTPRIPIADAHGALDPNPSHLTPGRYFSER
jgi:hypothetical protein